MQTIQFLVGTGMRSELHVLEEAGVGNVVEVLGLHPSIILVNNLLRVEICCNQEEFKTRLQFEPDEKVPHPLKRHFNQRDTIFLLLIKHSEFSAWLQLINSTKSGKPIFFYFALAPEEIPDLLMNIASNLQNQEEFREFMDKARDELQDKLLRLS